MAREDPNGGARRVAIGGPFRACRTPPAVMGVEGKCIAKFRYSAMKLIAGIQRQRDGGIVDEDQLIGSLCVE